MDKRKNNGGHSTKGFAGRKPKAKEIKIAEELDKVADLNAVFKALFERVKDNDVGAIKLWLSYRLGLPKQSIDHTTNGDNINASITPISFVKSNDD